MLATHNHIVTAFDTFLKAGGNFGDQMRAVAAKGTPCPELIEALAQCVARHYKCHAAISNKGSWNFYKAKDSKERHDSALTCWKRNVKPWINPEAKPAVRKQVDKIEATATRLQKQLNKRDIARLIKLLSQ